MHLNLKNCWVSTVVISSWLLICLSGLALLLRYEATAGSVGNVPVQWPQQALQTRQDNSSSLLMFAHPRCPCTRASLKELAVVIACCPRFESIRVVFSVPPEASTEWRDTDLVRQAKGIAGVEIVFDEGGQLSAQFGTQTSGHTLLYDESGQLTFSGGITGLRGHEGPNTGRAAVITHGQQTMQGLEQTAVFGCPLVGTATEIANVICRNPHER